MNNGKNEKEFSDIEYTEEAINYCENKNIESFLDKNKNDTFSIITKEQINIISGYSIEQILEFISNSNVDELIQEFSGDFSINDAKIIESKIRNFEKSVITLNNGNNGFIIDYVPCISDVHIFETFENGKMRGYLDGYDFFAREIESVDGMKKFITDGGRYRDAEGYSYSISSYGTCKKIIGKNGETIYTNAGEYDRIKEIYETSEDMTGSDSEKDFLNYKEDDKKDTLDMNKTYRAISILKEKLEELGIKYDEISYETSGHNSQNIIKIGGKDLVNTHYQTYSNGTIRYWVYDLKENMVSSLLEKAKELDNNYNENIKLTNNFDIIEFIPKYSNIEHSSNKSSLPMVAPMVSGNITGNNSKYYTHILGDYKVKVGDEEFYLILDRSDIDQFSKSGSFRTYKLSKEEYESYKGEKSLYYFESIEDIDYEITGWTSSIGINNSDNTIFSKILEKNRKNSNREKSHFIYENLNDIGIDDKKISELFKDNGLQVMLNFAIASNMKLESFNVKKALKYFAWSHLHNIIPNNEFHGSLENIHKGLELYIENVADGMYFSKNNTTEEVLYSTEEQGIFNSTLSNIGEILNKK